MHFKDIQLLDTHVLNPKWVTEGVYRIINSRALAAQKGLLPLNSVAEALKKQSGHTFDYPENKHQFLIDLMLKFELCYRLGETAVLVPDLLDIQEPAFDFDASDAVNFVFEYAYLPRSVMPRFIVRMHSDIQDHMRWRSGVILSDNALEARALVRSDAKAKRIYVSVVGAQRRDYFSIVRKVISDINSSFERLPVTELIPLAGHPEVELQYSELLGYEKAGRNEIFIGRLGVGYDVQRLLNGVELPAVRGSESVINVSGDYYAGTTTVNTLIDHSKGVKVNKTDGHVAATWEKIVVYFTAVAFVGLVGYLVVRNEPFKDQNLVVFVRILISLFVAALGATIPGLLKVDFSGKGLRIRALGALGLFVIAYFVTPQVLPIVAK